MTLRATACAAIVLALSLTPGHADAQRRFRVAGAVFGESYSFGETTEISSISEMSIPLLAEFALGQRGRLTVSTGWGSVRADRDDGEDLTISGILDTQARVSLDVVPTRMSLLLTGTLPTGQADVEHDAASVLSVVAAEALDFTVARFGSGGEIGGGVVGAFPAGPLALGVAATFHHASAYQPLVGGVSYQPGREMRVRIGAEGRLGSTTHLRLAGIFSRRGDDRIDGASAGTPGDQWTGYGSLQKGNPSSIVTLYAFGSVRTGARVEDTSFGPALLPESRSAALGARWSFTVRRGDALTPAVEVRTVRAGSANGAGLDKLGATLRTGLEYRLRVAPAVDLLFRGEWLTGEVRAPFADEMSGVSGYRAGVQLEMAN